MVLDVAFRVEGAVLPFLADADRRDRVGGVCLLYADDLVEWLFAVLDRGEPARPYNVGSARSVSIRELAETVLRTLGGAREVRVMSKAGPGPASVYVPDVGRAIAELGVRENFGLEESIRRSAV